MAAQSAISVQTVGTGAGYIFSYLLFTTILFFALTFLGKLPQGFSYFGIVPITLGLVLIGESLKRLLK